MPSSFRWPKCLFETGMVYQDIVPFDYLQVIYSKSHPNKTLEELIWSFSGWIPWVWWVPCKLSRSRKEGFKQIKETSSSSDVNWKLFLKQKQLQLPPFLWKRRKLRHCQISRGSRVNEPTCRINFTNEPRRVEFFEVWNAWNAPENSSKCDACRNLHHLRCLKKNCIFFGG